MTAVVSDRVDQSRQSSSRAASASPNSAIVWSIPPVGAPATSLSARMQARTSEERTPSSTAIPASSAAPRATEHSMAAELDSPAPSGTLLSTVMSMPGRSQPSSLAQS